MIETVSHPAPHRSRVRFWILLFGIGAAPIMWMGLEWMNYIVTSLACYGSDHPTTASETYLRSIMTVCDVLALLIAAASGFISYRSWLSVKHEKEGDHRAAIDTGDGRARFLSLWGIIASLWFFAAILFLTIASLGAPLCTP